MSRVLDSDDEENVERQISQNDGEPQIVKLSTPSTEKSSARAVARIIESDDDDDQQQTAAENVDENDHPPPASPDNEDGDAVGASTQFFRVENEQEKTATDEEDGKNVGDDDLATQFFNVDVSKNAADVDATQYLGTTTGTDEEDGKNVGEGDLATQFFNVDVSKNAADVDATQYFATTEENLTDAVDRSSANDHVTDEDLIEEAAKNDPNEEDRAVDDEEQRSEVGELIADIFGESDQEENVVENEEEAGPAGEERGHEEDEEENVELRPQEEEFVSDFDLMMEKRHKQSQRWRRKKKDYEFITYNDDMIAELLSQMKVAAKEDLDLNSMQMPATRKRALLSVVLREIRKADLVSGFIEAGVVSVMAQWLSLLPDKSLPALEIRTQFLKILLTFPTLDHQILRSSNIGKAVMLLFKHPKELKENKERAQKLISEWARPIFNLQTDYRSLSKDERLKRDYDHMPLTKKRRLSLENEPEKQGKKAPEENIAALGPGDRGFIGRARVPRPSTRDYVVRPKWNVETEIRDLKNKKHTESKMDKKIREIKMRSSTKKTLHAVGVSLEGRKIAI